MDGKNNKPVSLTYYNENDPKAAAWLRKLIAAGIIPGGDVDQRSISEVRPSDLRSYIACHFFAGIGGWAYALKLAGWPTKRKVWTGSCPCQPFSVAGQGKGEADERHLWPVWFNLIRECNPSTVFGEQVASPAALLWLDGVFADMEGKDYACGASDLCAAGINAPHIRQRLFWVADAKGERYERATSSTGEARRGIAELSSTVGGMEHSQSDGRQQRGTEPSRGSVASGCSTGRLGQSDSEGRIKGKPTVSTTGHGDTAEPAGNPCGMVHAEQSGLEGHAGNGDDRNQPGRQHAPENRPTTEAGVTGAWSGFDIIPCADGKSRRVESGTFPLAHGVPGRVGLLRGYGNAIVPQLAAEFIQAAIESLTS